MNTGIVVVIIVIVMLLSAFAKSRIMKKTPTESGAPKDDQAADSKTDMENVYFEEIAKGEKPYRLMEITDQFELMFLKSLFQSEQIPYNVDSEHVSSLYPGIKTGFHILEKDYNDAMEIVEDFEKNRLKNIQINRQ